MCNQQSNLTSPLGPKNLPPVNQDSLSKKSKRTRRKSISDLPPTAVIIDGKHITRRHRPSSASLPSITQNASLLEQTLSHVIGSCSNMVDSFHHQKQRSLELQAAAAKLGSPSVPLPPITDQPGARVPAPPPQREQHPRARSRLLLETQLTGLVDGCQILGAKASSIQLKRDQQQQQARAHRISTECNSMCEAVVGAKRKALRSPKFLKQEELVLKRTRSMHSQRAMQVLRELIWRNKLWHHAFRSGLMQQWRRNTIDARTQDHGQEVEPIILSPLRANGTDFRIELESVPTFKTEQMQCDSPVHSTGLSTALGEVVLSRVHSNISICNMELKVA